MTEAGQPSAIISQDCVLNRCELHHKYLFEFVCGRHDDGCHRTVGLQLLDVDILCSPDLPFWWVRRDDQAEPQGEDDAQGDGGSCQPSGDSNLGMETGDPVGPASAKMTLLSTMR